MSIKRNLTLTIFSLMGFGATAEPSISEFFYQAPAGKAVGTIQAGYMDREYKVTPPGGGAVIGTAADKGLTAAGLRYEKGLSDMWSLEGVVTYTALSRSSATAGQDNGQAQGLDDVQINLKGTAAQDGYRLRFGASNSIGIFPATFSTTSTGASGNNNFTSTTGSYTFTPYIGADTTVGNGLLGAKVSYDLLKHDRSLHGPAGAPTVYGGGQDFIVSLFYEWSLEPSLIGLSLNYFNESGSTLGTTQQAGWISYGANLYARFGWTDAWTIIPSVGYDMSGSKNNVDYYTANTIDSGNAYKVNLALRYAF